MTAQNPSIAARVCRRLSSFAALALVGGLAFGGVASAQSWKSIQTPSKPLTLKSRGSFYVGGEPIETSAADVGLGPADAVTVNQMYVDYMVPTGRAKTPVVLIHGAGLSGKSYDTTPDGRIGWFEYFVRQGHPTYVIDQVGRARSGFNIAALNRRITEDPASRAGQPGMANQAGQRPPIAFRFGSRNGVWTNFRFGPKYGETFPGSQVPTEAIDELAKQAIPDLSSLVPQPNPTLKDLADLAVQIDGAVLLGHSQSGAFPFDAALTNPAGVRAIVSVEPGGCRSTYTDAQIATLAKIPTYVLFGDNLPADTGLGANAITWQNRYDGCLAFAARIKGAGGKIDVVRTTDLGIRGNSHMLMQDRNSNQIADIILKWIDGAALKKAG